MWICVSIGRSVSICRMQIVNKHFGKRLYITQRATCNICTRQKAENRKLQTMSTTDTRLYNILIIMLIYFFHFSEYQHLNSMYCLMSKYLKFLTHMTCIMLDQVQWKWSQYIYVCHLLVKLNYSNMMN